MRAVPWRGKAANHVTVGKGPMYDFSNLQSALDWIEARGDAAADNRYLVDVGPGRWLHDAAGPQIVDNLSHVDVVGTPASIFINYRTPGAFMGGGVIAIGSTTTASVTDKLYKGIRIVNNNSGWSLGPSGGGGPPEGGLYVGDEEGYPDVLTWDQIILEDLYIEGVHDGLQVFGQSETYTGEPSRLEVRNCLVKSCHDAITVKGDIRGRFLANQVEVNAGGVDPYLTQIKSWKHTGFHHNVDRGQDGSGTRNPLAFVHGVGNIFAIFADDNSASTGQQGKCCGVLLGYSSSSAMQAVRAPIRQLWESTIVRVVYDVDFDYTVSGFMAACDDDATGVTIPENQIVIRNFMVDVHNLNTGASAPSIVAGLWLEATQTALLKAADGWIDASNAGAGSAYSIYCQGTGATIERDSIRSDIATGGTGTLSPLPTK